MVRAVSYKAKITKRFMVHAISFLAKVPCRWLAVPAKRFKIHGSDFTCQLLCYSSMYMTYASVTQAQYRLR